jgi:uncharacterized protein
VALRLSKSIRFGAVRFNLSGSGIGVSVGMPGLRMGTGPRGAYISGSLGAFRYRKSLGCGQRSGNASDARRSGPEQHTAQPTIQAPHAAPPRSDPSGIAGRTTYDTASVLELSDASSEGVLESIREQRTRTAHWPVAAVAGVLVVVLLAWAIPQLPAVVLGLASVAAVSGTIWMRWRDQLRRLTVLFYELDDDSATRFEALSNAVYEAATASQFTAVTSQVAYSNRKRHSGADHGISTQPARATSGFPAGLIANVAVPMLHAEKTTLAFLPDRVLLIQGSDLGAIEYASLHISCRPVTIIESTSQAPADATVISSTWRYPNKDGGPDRRFKDNFELPKCRYSELALVTNSGLNLRFMSSRDNGLEMLSTTIARMTGAGMSQRVPARAIGADQQEATTARAAFNAGAPSNTFSTIAAGILAVILLFGVGRGLSLARLNTESSTAPNVASSPDEDIARQKALADAQPSFDCRKAKSASERLICGSSELAALDRALAMHFDATRQSLAETDRRAFATEARKAWQARDSRCRDVACLSDWYQTRTTQLDAWDSRLAERTAAAAAQASGTQLTTPARAQGMQPIEMIKSEGSSPAIFHPTQSFCPSPQSDAQRIICSDIDLGGRQLALDRRYDQDRLRLEPKLVAERFAAFLAEGEAAVRFRDQQCHEKDCIVGWFRGRGEQLAVWETTSR